MTHPRPRHAPANRFTLGRALGLTVGLALATSLIVDACSPTTPTPSSAPSSATFEPSSDATSSASSANATPAAGQTDTDWGRIWDGLPAAFPVYPGATPAQEAETGPVSATFALEGPDAKTIVDWMRTELERAAYSTEALTGPLEDGSFVLESIGAADCRAEVAVAPLGALTTVTVRYGASCPSP